MAQHLEGHQCPVQLYVTLYGSTPSGSGGSRSVQSFDPRLASQSQIYKSWKQCPYRTVSIRVAATVALALLYDSATVQYGSTSTNATVCIVYDIIL